MSQRVHVNSATAIVGLTGSGKSSLLATAAEFLADTHPGKKLYLYTIDGGGFPAYVQALIRQGIIRVWRCRTRGEPFETCMRASAGWWPSQINPITGETAPGVRLVPPVTQTFTMKCPEGHVVKVVPYQALLTATMCPTCRKAVTKETMLVEKQLKVTKGFEERGAFGFDSLTSACSWLMLEQARLKAHGILRGEGDALGGIIESGDMKLGGSTRAHFGFTQTRSEEMVLNSLSIPNLILPPMFTALLLETTDEAGLAVKGPKLAGQAKTDECPAWFGNCLEASKVPTDKGEVYRLTLEEYTDERNCRHLIKHRGAPGTMPAYLQDEPEGPAFKHFNLGVFFTLLDEGVQKTEARLAEKFPLEALPERMTFGEEEPAPVSAGLPPSAPASPRSVAPAPVPSTPGAGAPAHPPAARPPAAPPAPARPPAATTIAPAGTRPAGVPPAPRAPARAPVAPPPGAAPELEPS